MTTSSPNRNFLCWTEIVMGGSNKGYYYLTDRHLFSKEGEIYNVTLKKLKKCIDSGVGILGHDAISDHYNHPRSSFGEQKHVPDFWNTDKLPRELANKVKEFDKHWGKMFTSGYFLNKNLCYVILNAPNEWQEKAWGQLKKQNPTAKELYYLLENIRNIRWEGKIRDFLIFSINKAVEGLAKKTDKIKEGIFNKPGLFRRIWNYLFR